jgi:hypothetical protein
VQQAGIEPIVDSLAMLLRRNREGEVRTFVPENFDDTACIRGNLFTAALW